MSTAGGWPEGGVGQSLDVPASCLPAVSVYALTLAQQQALGRGCLEEGGRTVGLSSSIPSTKQTPARVLLKLRLSSPALCLLNNNSVNNEG